MNDNELDEMLDQWKVPPMRASLAEELRTQIVRKPAIPRIRVRRIVWAAIAAAALLFGVVQFSPRTARMAAPDFRIPFYVEFAFTRYTDGRFSHRSYMTSFPYGGHEITMSEWAAGHTHLSAFQGIVSAIRNQVILLEPSLVLPKEPPMAEPAWFPAFVKSGCASGRNVVGHETIAEHATTMIRDESPTFRTTTWLAPDLSCYALKMTQEYPAPDGTYKMFLRKEAVKVTMNP